MRWSARPVSRVGFHEECVSLRLRKIGKIPGREGVRLRPNAEDELRHGRRDAPGRGRGRSTPQGNRDAGRNETGLALSRRTAGEELAGSSPATTEANGLFNNYDMRFLRYTWTPVCASATWPRGVLGNCHWCDLRTDVLARGFIMRCTGQGPPPETNGTVETGRLGGRGCSSGGA